MGMGIGSSLHDCGAPGFQNYRYHQLRELILLQVLQNLQLCLKRHSSVPCRRYLLLTGLFAATAALGLLPRHISKQESG